MQRIGITRDRTLNVGDGSRRTLNDGVINFAALHGRSTVARRRRQLQLQAHKPSAIRYCLAEASMTGEKEPQGRVPVVLTGHLRAKDPADRYLPKIWMRNGAAFYDFRSFALVNQAHGLCITPRFCSDAVRISSQISNAVTASRLRRAVPSSASKASKTTLSAGGQQRTTEHHARRP